MTCSFKQNWLFPYSLVKHYSWSFFELMNFFKRVWLIHHFSGRKIQFVFEMVTRVESHDNLQFHYVPGPSFDRKNTRKPVLSKSKTFPQIAWKTSKRKELDEILYQYDEESMLYHFFRALPYEYIYLCDTKIQVLSHFWWDSESTQNFIFFFFRVAEVTFRWKKILLNISTYFALNVFWNILERFR